MKTDRKTTSTAHPEIPHRDGQFRVAIIGAASLKGRELKDVLTDRNFPARDIRLLDDDESLGQLEAVGEEPTFIQSVLPEHLNNVDFTFFASEETYTRNTWQMAKNSGSDIIDLSYGLEGEKGVALRAPWVERELGVTPALDFGGDPVLVAHPAAIVLGLLMLRVQKLSPIVRTVASIFEPASERGKRGMDELHEQTVNLLSFQQLPKSVFDAQVAFNLLNRFGPKSLASVTAIEQRIAHHFTRIVNGNVKMPSLMLLQAPIFHGHAFAINLELESAVGLEEFLAAIKSDHIDVLSEGEELPSNVNAAGQEQIQVAVQADSAAENAFWVWAACDNLRILAINAVECAESMTSARPRGAVQ